MTPAERIVSALEASGLTVRGSGERGWTAQCPAHEDRNPSLSISVGDDERALLHCHAGCSLEEIIGVLGLKPRQLFPDRELAAVRYSSRSARVPSQQAAPTVGPPPDTRKLLEQVITIAKRFVVLPGEAEAAAIALFVLHTWALDGAHATPYLLVVSPEKRSGKTRLLEMLALLVRQPWHTNSTSEAAMFRRIERDQPTLLLDEIDAIFGSNSERTEPLRAILNSGNRRGVTVTRCAGKEHEVAEFSVWCAKVLAGIDKDRRLPDTIRDRAISIRMRRRHVGEAVERFRERKARALTEPIRQALEAWAAAAVSGLAEAEPELPNELDDRAADAWEPLFAIADLAGGDWPARARKAATELGGGEADEDSYGVLLLSTVRRLMKGRGVMSSGDLVDEINMDDELPFGGWNGGKGIDNRSLARTLKPYDIKPRGVRIGDKTLRGYRAEDLRDAWARYLQPDVPANSVSVAQHEGYPQHKNARGYRDVADVADVALLTGVGAGEPTDYSRYSANGHGSEDDIERAERIWAEWGGE